MTRAEVYTALTRAEVGIFNALVNTDLTVVQIATRHQLSRYTVKSHSVSIYHKLGVTGRVGLVQLAARAGLVEQTAGEAL